MLLGDGLNKKANGKPTTTFAIPDLVFVPKRIRSTASIRDDEAERQGEEVEEREEHLLTLRDPNIRSELLERLNTFRKNRELCDVVLFVAETEIFAHKVVLAATSPALFDMFLNNEESSPQRSVTPPSSATPQREFSAQPASTKQPMAYFEFADTDYDSFSALVNYAYTAHLEVSSRKVAELHKTACALRMQSVVDVCSRYLAANLNVENCIGIRKQANFTNDAFLVEKVDEFIAGNFERINSESQEFTQLPCIKTRIIVSAEDGGRQVDLNEKILEYFQSMPRKRDRIDLIIEALASKTHILYLDGEQKLVDCSKLDDHSNVGSTDVIQDYKRSGQNHVMGTPHQEKHVTGAKAVRLEASRLSQNGGKYASNESLASTGSTETDSEDEGDNRLITINKTTGDFWVGLAVLHHRLVSLSNQVTDDEELVRGAQKNADTRAVRDLAKNQKSSAFTRLVTYTGNQRQPLAHMISGRCSVGAAFLNGKIIVCGGYDRGACMKTVEEYDVTEGKWNNLPSMIAGRGRFDSAVLNGKIYAIAGSNGTDDLKSVEVFDPKLGKWTALKPLITARSHNGCAALENHVYCIGGISDQNVLKDSERYNPETGEWEKIAPLEVARYQAGCTAWRGLIVACGGNDRWNTIDSVEAFDPKTNTWKQLAKLRTPRRGCAVAVVRDSLYVIGGNDGSQPLNSVEVLDHPTSQWRAGPPLTTPRANTHAVVTAGGVIYVIGGFDGRFLDTIELLENEAVGWRNWQQIGSTLEEDDNEGDDDASKSNNELHANGDHRAVSAS